MDSIVINNSNHDSLDSSNSVNNNLQIQVDSLNNNNSDGINNNSSANNSNSGGLNNSNSLNNSSQVHSNSLNNSNNNSVEKMDVEPLTNYTIQESTSTTNTNNNKPVVLNNIFNQNSIMFIRQSIKLINNSIVLGLDKDKIKAAAESSLKVTKSNNHKCTCSKLTNGAYCSTSICGCRKNGGLCTSNCKCVGNCNNSNVGNDILFFKVMRNMVIRKVISSFIQPLPPKLTAYEKHMKTLEKRRNTINMKPSKPKRRRSRIQYYGYYRHYDFEDWSGDEYYSDDDIW